MNNKQRMLVVRPEFQGQGYMRSILEDVYKMAEKKGTYN